MSRWTPDARERLERAAFELFAENGYENTTVAQIADRAGLNRATFFRHFSDKREVLFGDGDRLAELLVEGIRAAPVGASLQELLGAALKAAAAVMSPEQRRKAAHRVRVLAESSEVQERGALKHARTAAAVRAAVLERGIDDVTARLAAETVLVAFSIALEGWLHVGAKTFQACAAEALLAVQTSAGYLAVAPSDHLAVSAPAPRDAMQ